VKNVAANELILNKGDSMGTDMVASINRTTVGFHLVHPEGLLQDSPLKAGIHHGTTEDAVNSYKMMRP
jgi:hypothetical protein